MPRLHQSSARRERVAPHLTVVEKVGRETLAALAFDGCLVAIAREAVLGLLGLI